MSDKIYYWSYWPEHQLPLSELEQGQIVVIDKNGADKLELEVNWKEDDGEVHWRKIQCDHIIGSVDDIYNVDGRVILTLRRHKPGVKELRYCHLRLPKGVKETDPFLSLVGSERGKFIKFLEKKGMKLHLYH